MKRGKMRKEVNTDMTEIGYILNKADVLHLGLADEQGPYVVPVNFAYAEGKIYFHSSYEGRKAAALRSGQEVGFCAEIDFEIKTEKKACKWGGRFKSVIGVGQARFIEGHDDKIPALELLMSKYADGQYPFDEKVVDKTAVVVIEIKTATARIKD